MTTVLSPYYFKILFCLMCLYVRPVRREPRNLAAFVFFLLPLSLSLSSSPSVFSFLGMCDKQRRNSKLKSL